MLHRRSRASPGREWPESVAGRRRQGGRPGCCDRDLPLSAPVAAYDDPGEAPTPRAFSDRDGYFPALRLEVLPQRCRLRRGHIPGEHLIVLLRGERDEVTVRLLLIHLQHVGTMGDVLEATASTRRASRPLSDDAQPPRRSGLIRQAPAAGDRTCSLGLFSLGDLVDLHQPGLRVHQIAFRRARRRYRTRSQSGDQRQPPIGILQALKDWT
jgi:hypothetical protein